MAPSTDDRECDVASLADALRKRAPLLARLADGPRDQRDLRDELGVSRSTVYKSGSDLAEAGLVAECEEGYALTEFGHLAWQRHDAYLARLRRLDEARPPAARRDPGGPAAPAVAVRARPHHRPGSPRSRAAAGPPRGAGRRRRPPPRRLAGRHAALPRDAPRERGRRRADGDDDRRLESGYDRFEVAVDTDGLEVRTVVDELPFALGLFDDEDVMVGAAFTGDEDALRWGRRIFDRIRDRSEPV